MKKKSCYNNKLSTLLPEWMMDEIQLRIMSRHMESCVMIITETWLDNNVPDAAIELAGRSVAPSRQDCSLR